MTIVLVSYRDRQPQDTRHEGPDRRERCPALAKRQETRQEEAREKGDVSRSRDLLARLDDGGTKEMLQPCRINLHLIISSGQPRRCMREKLRVGRRGVLSLWAGAVSD